MNLNTNNASPLAEGRGLKLIYVSPCVVWLESPLAEGRGLKLSSPLNVYYGKDVAPRRGAWIETLAAAPLRAENRSRPSQRGVD